LSQNLPELSADLSDESAWGRVLGQEQGLAQGRVLAQGLAQDWGQAWVLGREQGWGQAQAWVKCLQSC
jgi:hypothetical protein